MAGSMPLRIPLKKKICRVSGRLVGQLMRERERSKKIFAHVNFSEYWAMQPSCLISLA